MITQYESLFSAQAFDLLSKLLKYDPEERIGCGPDGVNEIKQHEFFHDLNWDLIERKGQEAPFLPQLADGEIDVSNFDESFTSMNITETPVDTRFSEYFGV